MIFGFKDSLRQAVEAASGGLATVMYTPKGQPIFMRRITPFRLEDLVPDGSLGTGWHPAFPNGREFWVSIYHLSLHDGEFISVPGSHPYWRGNAQLLSVPLPPGMRFLGIREHSAIALWGSRVLGDVLRGPDNWGQNSLYPWETGVRLDGFPPGHPGGPDPRVYPGSGPVTWRHDHSPFGVELYLGRLWLADFRFRKGQFQIRAEDAPLVDPFNPSDDGWLAITPDGELVSASSSNPTLGYVPEEKISTNWDANNSFFSFTFANLRPDTGLQIPPIVRALGLAPSLYQRGRGFIYKGNDNFLCAGAMGNYPGALSGLGVPGEYMHVLLVYRW